MPEQNAGPAHCSALVSQDLPASIPAQAFIDPAIPDWELQVAYDINDAGRIVGQGLYKGQTRAFLLEP